MRCITNAEGVYVNRCVYTTYVCMYMYVCLLIRADELLLTG